VITRRRFLTGSVITLTPIGATASAQEYKAGKVYRVGAIGVTPVAVLNSDPTIPFNSGFRREMGERGYVEGQNLSLRFGRMEGTSSEPLRSRPNWSASMWI
jgi:hypothetical protein